MAFALDQITKALMLQFLSDRSSLPVLPGLFHLTLIRNAGVAFGLFQGYGLLITLATLALLGVVVRSSMRKGQAPARLTSPGPGQGRLPLVCLGLIVGGAVGNLADRIRFGAVIDFLDFRVWPVFNVADSCVTVGAVLLAVGIWRRRG